MVSMVSLAAAIGIPIIAPDRGILPAIITAVVIVCGQWIISKWAAHNSRVETSINDDFTILIEDSVMQFDDMQQTRVTYGKRCLNGTSLLINHSDFSPFL